MTQRAIIALRFDGAVKERIRKVAHSLGVDMTSFILTSVMKKVKKLEQIRQSKR